MSSDTLYDTDTRYATLDELSAAARDRLEPAVWEFLEGGAGRERTLAANRNAFAEWQLMPRVMTGAAPPDVSASFMGLALDVPWLTAPFGGDRLFHPDGHLATVAANAAAGAGTIAPEAGSHSLEEIAERGTGAPRLFQLHPMEPRERFVELGTRARRAGYAGLCVTVDCPVAGWRERNMRNRFAPDFNVFAGHFVDGADYGAAEMFAHLSKADTPTWTWNQLADACADAGLPWMAKGVLHPADAIAAAEAGASAVLVSNHGGRQLDGAPASLRALPAIADAVGGQIDVALDSGVRTGTDVALALALGADVVVLGRLTAHALAADGRAGVARMHTLLRDELRTVMLLCGRSRPAGLRGRAVAA